MGTGQLVIAILIIIVALIIVYLLMRRRRGPIPTKVLSEDESIGNYNEDFIRVSFDRSHRVLVKTFSQIDSIFIRSIFSSEGIYSYVENENMNNLYPGMSITGYSDLDISVFDDQREAALAIVTDYIESLKASAQEQNQKKPTDFDEVKEDRAMFWSRNRILPEIVT